MARAESAITGKAILVTGAGGFIGSHLVERLVALGARPRALVRYTSRGDAGWLTGSPAAKHVQIVRADITDRMAVGRAVDGCEIVIHLAALIGIPYSYEAPASYVRTNVEGTLALLEAARVAGVSRFVHTSTSEVYGSARYAPIDEGHPLQAQSPYSATKIAADKLVESFHYAFGLPAVIIRPFNTYGPRQSARAVVPTIITQTLRDGSVELGNVSPTRDLTYVADTVDGFVRACTADRVEGEVIHLGTGVEESIGDLAARIGRVLGRTIDVRVTGERTRPRGSEVDRLCADTTRARDLLGWSPAHTLDQGLRLTVDWIREHLHEYRTSGYAV